MTLNRFTPARSGNMEQTKANDRLSNVVDAAQPPAFYPVSAAANLSVGAGCVQRCSPRAAGQNVVIPEATAANFGQAVTLIVENALGALRVRAAAGTINGATAFTLAAGYTTLIVLRSNGAGKWVSERASGFPIAGNSLAYTGETLNYVGTDSEITNSAVAGDLGTVDISTLACGGSVNLQATADWTIRGFTSRNEGFWFFLSCNNTNFIGTLTDDDGTVATLTNRMRLTNETDWYGNAVQALVYYANTRWRIVVTGPNTGNVQRFTTAGLSSNLVLAPGTRTLEVDTGNSAWSIDGIAGGWPGRKLTIRNSSNIASTGTLITQAGSASLAVNQIVTPDNLNRGGWNRYSAELEYDGVDSIWRITSDTANNTGRLMRRTVLTSGTAAVFNHIAGATTCVLEGVGGGGAGGGRAAGAGSGGSCGGSGTWGERTFAIVAATSTYTVGAAGVGVSGATGGNGTASSWTHNAVTTTLPAGSGGIFRAAAVGPATQAGGAGGGNATNADDSANGQQGAFLFMPAAAVQPLVHLGDAGSTPLGNGGQGTACLAIANITGLSGTGYGAGSSGNLQGAAGAAAAAPNGQPGVWIVEEYS